MELSLAATVWVIAGAMFAIGVVFGVLAERTAFCTMGAVADLVLFGGRRRARLWAGALAVAALGLNAVALAGRLDPADARAWAAPGILPAASGGLLFGIGMVTAGGCVSRAWIRAASGSIKGLAVVAAAALGIAVTAPLVAHTAEATPGAPEAFGLVVALALAFWVLRDPRVRRDGEALATMLGIGGTVTAAYLVTAPLAPDGVRFVLPMADAARGLLVAATPGLALIAGAVLGAAVSARRGGRRRPEPWVDRGDVLRHVGGGLAMGVGGTLATGCTVGAGITGTAAMAPSAWAALAGMVAGATCALRLMLVGGPRGAWRLLRRGRAGRP